MTKFKDNKQRYIYDLYTVEPPKQKGSGLSAYYFRAIEFPDKRNLAPERTSLAYAAYAAGRDFAKRQKAANQ
jgi:hypothetical protein